MAADLGISRIYTHRKMVGMDTRITKNLNAESMASDVHRNCLSFTDHQIKVNSCFLINNNAFA